MLSDISDKILDGLEEQERLYKEQMILAEIKSRLKRDIENMVEDEKNKAISAADNLTELIKVLRKESFSLDEKIEGKLYETVYSNLNNIITILEGTYISSLDLEKSFKVQNGFWFL